MRPAAFFRGIRRQGDFVNPLVFAVICSLFLGIIEGVLNMLNAIVAGTTGVSGAIASFVGNTMFTPVFVAVFLFVRARIYHPLVLLFVGPPMPDYRVAGYACAIFLTGWISCLSNLILVIGPMIGGSLGFLPEAYAVII